MLQIHLSCDPPLGDDGQLSSLFCYSAPASTAFPQKGRRGIMTTYTEVRYPAHRSHNRRPCWVYSSIPELLIFVVTVVKRSRIHFLPLLWPLKSAQWKQTHRTPKTLGISTGYMVAKLTRGIISQMFPRPNIIQSLLMASKPCCCHPNQSPWQPTRGRGRHFLLCNMFGVLLITCYFMIYITTK